jgi:hypothetical protein
MASSSSSAIFSVSSELLTNVSFCISFCKRAISDAKRWVSAL